MNIEEINAAANSIIDEERQKYAPPEQETKQEPDTLEGAIDRLAALSPIDYDKVRKEEAKKLGIKLKTLDDAVTAARKAKDDNKRLPFEDTEPWPEPVEIVPLLNNVQNLISKCVVCNKETANTVALWIVMTWVIDYIDCVPMLFITAPEKRCGKTVLLSIINKMARRCISASSISPAAMFRAIELWSPTLCIDEADACIRDNEELRGILNSGHTRDTAYVLRSVGDDHTPTMFNTFGAKAIAGIGRQADTLEDRSIIIELQRKTTEEKITRVRNLTPETFIELRRKLARFAEDHGEEIKRANPQLPEELNDRAQDNWSPLSAIAEIAGADWLKFATGAALKISGIESGRPSTGIELLTDIKRIFEKRDYENIFTSDLIAELCRDEERPWKTYVKGREMTPKHLAGKLREYKIGSCSVRVGENTGKGYKFEQFADAIKRYVPIPSNSAVTKSHCNNINNLNDFSAVTQPINVTDKNEPNSLNLFTCDRVTGEIPRTDAQIKSEALFDLGNEQVEVLL